MSSNLELWGIGTPRTFRPIWMAEELGLVYKLHPIGPRTGETQTSEFKHLNPKQKIPLLKHDDFTLSESVAICRYLLNTSPSPHVFTPKDLKELAVEDEWCNFIYGELDETSLYIMRRHHDLKTIYGAAPTAVQSCRLYFEQNLKVVEGALEEKNTLLGCRFGLADVLLVSCLDWASAYDIKLPRNTTKYLESMRSRSAYKKAFRINYRDLVL